MFAVSPYRDTGPSGHGKSLLARKCEFWIVCYGPATDCENTVGSLLDVPTHTVNMTTLRSTHDIWKSYSMNPYEVRACIWASFFADRACNFSPLRLAPYQTFSSKTRVKDVL